ncbi:MAG TPA: FecR domain-containing protein [Polyangiaceae bacterium]
MGPSLTDLFEAIARDEHEAVEQIDFTPHRQRFLKYAAGHQLRRKVLAWASVGAVAASLLLVVYVTMVTRPLTFDVAGRPGDVGAFLAAPERAALDVDFSDGSHLRLKQLGRARVLSLGSHSAHVMLERGSLRARVVHADKTNWQLDAGPFRVRVVGTSFDVAWEPSSERFQLELHEGAVAVSGPRLRGDCVVPAGSKLEVVLSNDSGSGTCVVSKPRDERRASRQPKSPSAPPSAPPRGAQAERSTPAASNAALAPATPDWRRLAAAGKHAAAWSAVQALGFERVQSGASAVDLTLLGNLARYSGQPAQARAALEDVRRRFPRSSEATHAAFLLGRVAADQQQAPAEGAHWFSIYLDELPAGPFAAEALGRLLDCQIKAGQRTRAYTTARRYLEHHPAGSYSGVARQVLAKAQ